MTGHCPLVLQVFTPKKSFFNKCINVIVINFYLPKSTIKNVHNDGQYQRQNRNINKFNSKFNNIFSTKDF